MTKLPDKARPGSATERQSLRDMAGDKRFEKEDEQSSSAQVSRSGKGLEPRREPKGQAEKPKAQVSRSHEDLEEDSCNSGNAADSD